MQRSRQLAVLPATLPATLPEILILVLPARRTATLLPTATALPTTLAALTTLLTAATTALLFAAALPGITRVRASHNPSNA